MVRTGPQGLGRPRPGHRQAHRDLRDGKGAEQSQGRQGSRPPPCRARRRGRDRPRSGATLEALRARHSAVRRRARREGHQGRRPLQHLPRRRSGRCARSPPHTLHRGRAEGRRGVRGPKSFVFSYDGGASPWHLSYLSHGWKRYAERAGITGFRPQEAELQAMADRADDRLLVSIPEAAQLLSAGRSTVYELINVGGNLSCDDRTAASRLDGRASPPCHHRQLSSTAIAQRNSRRRSHGLDRGRAAEQLKLDADCAIVLKQRVGETRSVRGQYDLGPLGGGSHEVC